MHPYISQALAAERIRELQNEASVARLASQARQARRRRPAAPSAPRASTGQRLPRPASETQLTGVEFLARTGGSLVREPSAAERAHGQHVA
jgi:hypothetical protein